MSSLLLNSRNQFLAFGYQNILKPIFFSFDAETVHVNMVRSGELMGNSRAGQLLTRATFGYQNPALAQEVAGIHFQNPIGLAAGFDYEAQLTQILAYVGFGFQTVGTMTNMAYEGNPRPMLGRLPNSRSLMVNKGFKNPGIKAVSKKLKKLSFPIPVGVSIGRSNSLALTTQKQSIADIISTFVTIENAGVKHNYYELNISCPNLFGNITFYPPKNLDDLLKATDKLKLKKPLFIKMPIEKSDKETRLMLDVIVKHKVDGVIFGNLQKDRKDPSLDQTEVAKFSVGNFSGKPTWKRSNQLVQLAYRYYGKDLLIIGCGGVFSAEDAYFKIKLGATLVQMITGMIYLGPQVISSINMGLVELLKKDGFKSISEAVGVDNKVKII